MPAEHRELMMSQVVEGVVEGLDGLQIGRVPLDQQVVERVVDVGRKLQRVVVGRPELRHPHPKFVLDLLPSPKHVHDARDDDAEDFAEVACQIGSDVLGIESGALEHGP